MAQVDITNRFKPTPLIALEQVIGNLFGKKYFSANETFDVLKSLTSKLLNSSHKNELSFDPSYLHKGLKSIRLKHNAYINENKPDEDMARLIHRDSFYTFALNEVKKLNIDSNPFNEFKIQKDTFEMHEATKPGNVMKHMQGICFAKAVYETMKSLVENSNISTNRLNTIFNECISTKLLICQGELTHHEANAKQVSIFCGKTKETMQGHFKNAVQAALQSIQK